MKVKFTCKYCNHIWFKEVYSKEYYLNHPVPPSCRICDDVNIKIEDLRSSIDYYQGCPPFPEKEPEAYVSLEGMWPDDAWNKPNKSDY